MIATLHIPVTRVQQSRISHVDFHNLEFGKYISDHMFSADYIGGEWKNTQIIPYGDLSVSPSSLALHYGQIVFEGMKAFRMRDGRISVFRIKKHLERLNRSLERMCMPQVSEELFVSAIHKLIETDRQWVPEQEQAALYLRPLIFASEPKLGVKISEQYKFLILASPAGAFYPKPLRVKVETRYVRAAEGGTGFVKCAGNYGGAFYPTYLAKQEGYDQVLWTDAHEHRFLDESGTMNLMFVVDGQLLTPPLSSTILDGVTRDSILQLARDMQFPCSEQKISIQEIEQALHEGRVTEAFGTGTAAVVAPIKVIGIAGKDYTLPDWSEKSFMIRVKKILQDIRTGNLPDRHQWNYIIP
ncbi:MAG: branched-chain-amino-acid transaminase 1 [Chitinophagales bacterium]|nr:MAG: branched-chain-amino-acid transaminase 1 [Chitinophagales bacterium]